MDSLPSFPLVLTFFLCARLCNPSINNNTQPLVDTLAPELADVDWLRRTRRSSEACAPRAHVLSVSLKRAFS